MNIKQKLFSGIGLLFAMIVVLTVLSSICIQKLSKETKNILVANYNTIDYSRNMLIALNGDLVNSEQLSFFENNLKQQQGNITEEGEKEMTFKLAKDFDKLKSGSPEPNLIQIIRTDISDIMLLNMQAIERKSKIAQHTADHSILWVSIVGTLCFLIAFILLFNLPNSIANPIKELSNSIQEIASQNYTQRVHFESHNEFGDLARSFNTMAEKLEEYKAGNIEKLLIQKKRIETLINNMNEPVLGLDDKNRVVFMNNNALKIAGLKSVDVMGRQVQDIAVHNDLVRSLIQDLVSLNNANSNASKLPVKIFANNKESYFEKELIPIRIIPTGESAEKLIGNVILLKNITEYKELDFAKTNFIATISHELKTPISSIKMSVQLLHNLQVGILNQEQKSLMDNINDDAERLLKITGELLNMTQVESGVIQLTVLPVNTQEIIEYAMDANRSSAEQKGIKVLNVSKTPLPKVLADSEKTAWVLTNLISNAIRYSYDNAIVEIDVSVQSQFVNISVTDSGQG
ncbi:MAG: HAMP domain-containing protein, partial [Chitinophagaceae bacterium]|nr:HAMP domain-containing protein [Chitinophagaceae bacterium]